MAVVYSATLKTNRMQLVTDLIDSKTAAASTGAGSAGKLVIGTGALAGPGATGVLATFTLSMPGLVVNAGPPVKLDLDVTPALSVLASGSGTAALAEFRNAADAVIVSGLTVGVGSGDIQLGSTTITAGGTVSITAGTITHG